MKQIQSVQRAFSILEALSHHQGKEGMGILRLASNVGLKSSTAHTLIKTLLNLGYAAQDNNTGKYRLGEKWWQLINGRPKQEEIIRRTDPFLIQLSQDLGETITLAHYWRGKRYLLSLVEHKQDLIVDKSLFAEGRLYTTPTGRVLLAYLEEKELKHCLEVNGFPGKDWNSINNWSDLQKALSCIRNKGYALRKRVKGQVTSLAVPILNGDKILVALGTFMPTFRFKEKGKERILSKLLKTAEDIAHTMSNESF